MKTITVIILGVVVVSALPYDDLVISKLDDGLRYQYVEGPDGSLYLVDLWVKASDLAEAERYNPDKENVYHLYTRQNPTVSQPMLISDEGLLEPNNYNATRRTKILLHGWREDETADFNKVVVLAFLAAEDANVIVVDWSAGAGTINYIAAVCNTVTSGESVGRFIVRLNSVTGASLNMYHVLGFSLGAHQAGIVGRTVGGGIVYISAFDPAQPGWITNNNKFRPSDGVYTEASHTNAGLLGYIAALAHVDFYPNRGIGMPGCNTPVCDHSRSYIYFAESIQTGGFTGRRCDSFITAMTGICVGYGNLTMGGLVPKTGQSGVYTLETNAGPPYSQG